MGCITLPTIQHKHSFPSLCASTQSLHSFRVTCSVVSMADSQQKKKDFIFSSNKLILLECTLKAKVGYASMCFGIFDTARESLSFRYSKQAGTHLPYGRSWDEVIKLCEKIFFRTFCFKQSVLLRKKTDMSKIQVILS